MTKLSHLVSALERNDKKMKKKLLISAIGGDIGYGVVKALKASDHNLHFIGFDIKKHNASLDLVDDFHLSPAYRDEKKWLGFVTGLIEECNVDYFWPITEPEIKIVNENMELFKQVSVVINTPNILSVALNKAETAKFLKAGGLHTPKTWGGDGSDG